MGHKYQAKPCTVLHGVITEVPADLQGEQRKEYIQKLKAAGAKYFASKGEAKRALELAFSQRRGEIDELEFQVSYEITVNDKKICNFKPDFRYIEDGQLTVEDFKGVATPVYKLKRKLFEALWPDIRFIESSG